MCGHKCLISEFLTFKMWSGNVVFGWHWYTCYVFFIGAIFYIIYIVQVKSMCVPILRSIGSELTKNCRSCGWNSGFRVFGDLWSMSYFFVSHALRMVYWNIHAKFHKNPSSMNGWYAAVKVSKNALCFIMGYLVAMVIRVTLYLLVQFCYMLYSIGPINVCTDFEINRYKIDEVRKYAKIVFYLIYLTSRDAKTLRHFW